VINFYKVGLTWPSLNWTNKFNIPFPRTRERSSKSKKKHFRGHSNQMWHFFAYFRPPSPMCHLVTQAWTPPSLLWCEIKIFQKTRLFPSKKTGKDRKIWFEILEKMSLDTLANPLFPLVAFGDTVPYLTF